jgi:hypothetical protein
VKHFWAIMGLRILVSSAVYAVDLDQIDDFQDGPNGWQNGMASGSVLLDGGPLGDGDSFLEVNANGDFGAFSRLTIFNTEQWAGNYIGAGVSRIEIDLKNLGTSSLSIRLAFKELAGGGGYASTQSFLLDADGTWRHAVFDLIPSAFTSIGAQKSFLEDLSNVSQLRIIHHAGEVPTSLNGDTERASVGIDNIRAVPEPSVAALVLFICGITAAHLHRRQRTLL